MYFYFTYVLIIILLLVQFKRGYHHFKSDTCTTTTATTSTATTQILHVIATSIDGKSDAAPKSGLVGQRPRHGLIHKPPILLFGLVACLSLFAIDVPRFVQDWKFANDTRTIHTVDFTRA